MSVSRETTCLACDGAGRIYWATGFDDRDGLIQYESARCARCSGSGLVVDDHVPRWIPIIAAVLFVAILAAAAALVWRRDLGLG